VLFASARSEGKEEATGQAQDRAAGPAEPNVRLGAASSYMEPAAAVWARIVFNFTTTATASSFERRAGVVRWGGRRGPTGCSGMAFAELNLPVAFLLMQARGRAHHLIRP